MAAQGATGSELLRTIAACILAPLTFLISAALVGGLWYFFNTALTIMRPGILNFMAACIGGLAGMYGARMMCDRWLQGYLPQAVFFAFASFVVVMAYLYAFVIPFEWGRLASYAQLSIVTFLAYQLFWKVEPID